ncbi:Hypothetical predicted protein [Cloeon dipterum]|uniref:Uncharacterized protein n=1 Tax=Cloeon dipterum TaxID=197152 RepID=A0A8S1DN74_9INSE|nr:Hypothetical predicted protein [Cloeon dipterum]
MKRRKPAGWQLAAKLFDTALLIPAISPHPLLRGCSSKGTLVVGGSGSSAVVCLTRKWRRQGGEQKAAASPSHAHCSSHPREQQQPQAASCARRGPKTSGYNPKKI